MISFNNLSIGRKIIILIVSVSTINTTFLTITEYYSQKNQFIKSTVQRLQFMGKIIGEGNTGAIIFQDKNSSDSYLQSFKVDGYIENAIILLPDSTILSQYSRSERPLYNEKPIRLNDYITIITNNEIIVSLPIWFKDEIIATLRIEYVLKGYKQKQKEFIISAFIILLISIASAAILAIILQKFITRPIYRLELIMKKISREKDYSIRSENKNFDEIGILSMGFNSMIAQIEKQNNELKKAKAQSDDALKAKERFLANITHELRTPLSSIIGLTTLIEDTALNQEQTEYFKNIKTSSNLLLSIINDLLVFSKLGSGKFQFEKKGFSLRRTIARIEGSLEFEIRNRELNLYFNISQDIPELIYGDEFRLNQILINLLGNAIKFTPIGRIEVSAAIKCEDQNTITLEFRVDDTGIGISEDKLEAIFESFTQESTSTNRKYGGTGLGLTITKQLIELQHGRIRVESEKGKGSSFVFFLPFDKRELPYAHTLAAKNQGTPFKIMLVDDNEMNLKLTKSILEKDNFNVTIFSNGFSAIERLKIENFDAILLDLHMPDVDGFEISKMIRALDSKEKSAIPIIALTAAATSNEINKCFDSGMNDYIVKPFNKDELITKLLNLYPETD